MSKGEAVEQEEERDGGSKSDEGDEKVLGPEQESRLVRLGRTLCVLLLFVKVCCPAGEGEGRVRPWYWCWCWHWDRGTGEVCGQLVLLLVG